MAMTLADFQSEIRSNIRRSSTVLSDARITLWTNWAQLYIAQLHTYKEMQVKDTSSCATTAHSNTVTWPSGMKDLYSAVLRDTSNSRKLVYVRASEFDTIVPYEATFGETTPEWYVDFGSYFELFPTPDAVYSIYLRVSKFPTDLVLSTATSTLTRKDALITAIATTFGFYSLREIEDAAYWGKTIVPDLYAASLAGDPVDADWKPIARGFETQVTPSLTGEWWTNPWLGRK